MCCNFLECVLIVDAAEFLGEEIVKYCVVLVILLRVADREHLVCSSMDIPRGAWYILRATFSNDEGQGVDRKVVPQSRASFPPSNCITL